MPQTATGELLLIREFRYPLNSWCIAFPAGLMEPGEDLATCVDRELREETGDVGDGQQERLDELRRLRLRVGHLLHLGEHDVHGFVGETGGRVARLRQRVERGRVGIGAQLLVRGATIERLF